MSVKVMIPTPLRVHAEGKAAAEFPAKTVAEALGHLTAEFRDLKQHLFTKEGKLRSFVNVYLNGEDIRYLEQENTATKDGDTINIIPSIAGGAPVAVAPEKLTNEEILRYSRHLIMPEVGMEGQLKLKK